MTSRTVPPFEAMITATFSIAGSMVASPTVLSIRTARSSARPWGSRTAASSLAIRTGDEVAINQPVDGRM